MAFGGTSKIGGADFLRGETEGEDERSSFPEVRAAGVPLPEGQEGREAPLTRQTSASRPVQRRWPTTPGDDARRIDKPRWRERQLQQTTSAGRH